MTRYNYRDYIVVSYDSDGKYLCTYKSAKHASESLGLFSRSIEKCIREKGKILDNKIWRRYHKNDDIPLLIEGYQKEVITRESKKVAKIGKKDQILEIYPSIREAAKRNKTSPKSIRDVLKGNQVHAGGYKWRLI